MPAYKNVIILIGTGIGSMYTFECYNRTS